MKVLDLCCSHEHGFEGWFASEEEFRAQLDKGLVECPMCADKVIVRRPSAPHLNVSGVRKGDPAGLPPQERVAEGPVQLSMQSLWLQAVQYVIAHSDDVGERFPEEARRIHYGEAQERAIRGQASQREAMALLEEGIDVLALPVPAALKGKLQ